MANIKIFISSPGDVPDERLRADLVIDKLSQDYGRFFTLTSYRWEHEPMLASHHFQDAIEPPSATDILVLIVWSRLGTALPEKTAVREYRGIDGRAPVTGTEWEFEDALASAKTRGTPDILAFRNTRPAPIDTCDADARAKSLRQLDALDAFWRRHFADKGVFIGAFEGYQSLEQFADILEQKLRKLLDRRAAALAGTASAPSTPGWTGSPFRGLSAYEFHHARIFFGRDAIVAQAARHLALAARYDNAFLLVAGASGSGKSSLVQAALVPRLMRPQRIEGLAFLRRVVFKPSDARGDLVDGFVTALVADGRHDGVGLPELLAPGQTSSDLAAHIRATVDAAAFVFSAALGRVTEDARTSGLILLHEQARLILVIDQLEELFTRDVISEVERSLFVRLIGVLAASGLVWVVATMRSDFWHRTAEIPELLALAAGERRLDVWAPSPLELADMIRKPIEVSGLSFERDAETGVGLDDRLAARAATEPGVLPLLSFTLDALFAEDIVKAGQTVLTNKTYEALGGLEGAIATRAEAIVRDLPDDVRQAVPGVLRALTTVSDGVDAIAVARTAPIERFVPGSDARRVVDAFVAGRLLVASGNGEHATVRVAHEALLSHWQRASDQIAIDRRDLETRKLIESQFTRWHEATDAGRANLLLRDPDLTNAIDLDRRWGGDLDADHRAYVQRSSRAIRAAARRRWMLASIVIALLGVLAALSLGALAVAERQRDVALIAQSRALARDASSAEMRGDLTLASLLALAALPASLPHPDRPFVFDAEYALANAFANYRERALLRHQETVNAVAFSPDGSTVATAGDDKAATVWDTASGRPLIALKGHQAAVNAIEFSHRNALIVTASDDGSARVWDRRSGRSTAVLNVPGAKVLAGSFAPDDVHVVAISSDGSAVVFDAASATHRTIIRSADSGVVAASFSPDSSMLATATDGSEARLWRVADGALIRRLPYVSGSGTAIAFAPDGRRIVCASDDGTARVWDLSHPDQSILLQGHSARINSVAFSSDGRTILTSSDDHTARIWNADTGAAIQTLLGHEGIVYSAAFSPDGSQVITASEDRTARVWEARNGAPAAVLGGHNAAVVSAVFAADGRSIATAAHEPTARLWNVDSSATRAILRDPAGIKVAASSPDGRRVATGSADGAVHIYERDRGTPVTAWTGKAAVRTIAFSPDGRSILVATSDRSARIWDVATGGVTILQGHEGAINAARYSADGLRVVTASDDKTARIWSVRGGTALVVLRHEDAVLDATFSPDGGDVVTASSDRRARLWDSTSGRLVATLAGHTNFVKQAVFSPDGTRIATAAGDGARLWDAKTGRSIAAIGSETVTSIAFAPDARLLATGSLDHGARVWSAIDGHFVRLLAGHDLPVRSVSFSSDGQRLLTGSDDRTSRYWDLATGKTIAVFYGHEEGVTSADFVPGANAFLSVSADRTARLWTLPPLCQELIDATRRALPREMTPQEQVRYFLDAPKGNAYDAIHRSLGPVLSLLVPSDGDICR